MVRATQVMDMLYYAQSIIDDAIGEKGFISRYQYNYGLAQEDQLDPTNTNLRHPSCVITAMDNGNHSDEHATRGNKSRFVDMETTMVRLFSMPVEIPSDVRPEIMLNKSIELYANLMTKEYELTFDIITNGPLESETIADALFYTYDLNNWVVPLTRNYETPIEIGTVVSMMDTTMGFPVLETLLGNVETATDKNWNGVRQMISPLDNENILVSDHHVEPLIKLNNIQQTQIKSDSRYTMNISFAIRFTHVTDIVGILPGYVRQVNSKVETL